MTQFPLYELRNAAKAGDDISAHEAAFLADGSPLAASALTFFYALRGRYPEIDRLMASENGRTRWGAVRAMSESFRAEHVDRLASALLDPDREVQKQAFTGLEDARKAGHTIQPSSTVLSQLDAAQREDIIELVYLWTTTDTLCRICANIDDIEFHGHEEEMPKEKHELVPAGEHVLRCPICDTRYHYDWSELYSDEFGSYGTWDLLRQPLPFGTRSEEQLRAGLYHPLRRVQRECAKELTTTALAAGQMQTLRELLAVPRRDVRIYTASLIASHDTPLPDLIPALRAILTDANEDVRNTASRALARELVRQRDTPGLLAMLTTDDRWVRRSALHAIEEAQELDLGPLRMTIVGLTSHPDDFVHGPARRILSLPQR